MRGVEEGFGSNSRGGSQVMGGFVIRWRVNR